jgi:hypothetical protein
MLTDVSRPGIRKLECAGGIRLAGWPLRLDRENWLRLALYHIAGRGMASGPSLFWLRDDRTRLGRQATSG